jgi:hypothetical protein
MPSDHSNELEPCECEGRAIILKDCGSEHFANLARAACTACLASTAFYETPAEAIAVWNRLNAASQAAVEGEREAATVDEIVEYFTQLHRDNPPISSYEVRCDVLDMVRKARATQSAPQPALDGLAAEFDAEVREMVTRLCPDESHGPVCSFCGRDPYHYVDNGVGMERVAVECCDLGIALYQHGDELLAKEVALKREAAALLTRLSSAPQPAPPSAPDGWFNKCPNCDYPAAHFPFPAPADGWEKKAAEIDEIMTRIYRRFKDWSQRKFSADDVTWCEVRADILEILQRHNPPQRLSEAECKLLDWMRAEMGNGGAIVGPEIAAFLAIIDRLAPQDGKPHYAVLGGGACEVCGSPNRTETCREGPDHHP